MKSMAIYIQLNKIEEDGTGAIYEFGPVERIVGHVVVDKSDGAVELLDIDAEYAAREAFYLPRIRRVFIRHVEENDFPNRTWYAA
jgi:hypothetical protein